MSVDDCLIIFTMGESTKLPVAGSDVMGDTWGGGVGNWGCPLPGVRASAGERGTSWELHGKCDGLAGLLPFACSLRDSVLGDCSSVLLWGESLPLVDDGASFVACAPRHCEVGVEGESSGDCFLVISVDISKNSISLYTIANLNFKILQHNT